ncbi:VOC family protein [Gramella sp. AN32]|uniref:VOC family protein n=1 Tax=Christiangramia antarctica TaxID=2058158 RepID=A0ABW5X309_9FLAO|nr:VOC family protein [Gramella sp. AN32]MCM4156853.1 glyoxalase [Gramella sp. AN32]
MKIGEAFGSFSTNDIQEARKFYRDTLNLKCELNSMGILDLSVGEQHFIIYPKPDHHPATFTVLNFLVENIEATVDSLIDKGLFFEQYKGEIKTDHKGISRSEKGPNIAWFKDPAGNILSIIEKK